jgi:O-antigen/teichoic acid export membrane protein
VNDDARAAPERLWSITRQALIALVVVGVVIAFFDAGVGAAMIVAAAGALVAAQVTISLVHYRRVMRRPWPAVEPEADDDDDW